MCYIKKEYDKEYKKKHYDSLWIQVKKDIHDRIKDEAYRRETSMNQLIISALEQAYGIDLSKGEE